MRNTRDGNDRRGNGRGTDRRSDAPSICTLAGMMVANAERSAALLAFPPLCLASDADARSANAAQLAECNSFLVSLLPQANFN